MSGINAASVGGAQRIELCSALDLGGLTPSEELFRDARAATELELLVIIRPEPGTFVVSTTTLQYMCAQIHRFHALGADGFVCGCLLPSGEVDASSLQQLVDAAGDLPLTFHRAFDQTPNLVDASDALIACGVKRVLTSGGANTAMKGAQALQRLIHHVGDRIDIVVGGSVRAHNLAELKHLTGATQFHSALDRNPTASSVRELVESLR